MAAPVDTPAWIALFIGLYLLAAGVGEMRAPGGWQRMLVEWESSPALRFLTGLFCVFGGAAIYLVSPWRPGDWLAIVVSVMGGLMVAEGLLMLAAGERFMAFARRLMAMAGMAWAGLAALVGIVLIVAALARI